ncbi:MAG TPA: protein translocase subunit SecF, partial [Pedococcus sp.]|nr:protein translocase subunit SecF [Pedococcus sp.]
IAAVLVMGFTLIGPGTLVDLSLVLFIGMAVGAYSSIFLATPLLVTMRGKEPAVVELDKAAAKFHAKQAKVAAAEGARLPQAEAEAVAPEAANQGADQSADESAEQRERVSAASTAAGRKIHPYAQTGPRNQPKRAPKSRR